MIRALTLTALLASIPASASTDPSQCIDSEIVFLADVSGSMANYKQMQRAGYANAFRSAEVLNQISAGACGAIAVQYMEFADKPKVVVDWTVVATDEDAEAFAQAIERAPESNIGKYTNISAAMDFAAQSVLGNGIEGQWRVVDVSTDGQETAGDKPSTVRDKYTRGPIWQQVTFNGLPLDSGHTLPKSMQEYFLKEIVGGPKSFLVPPVSMRGLGEAVIRKLQNEIM